MSALAVEELDSRDLRIAELEGEVTRLRAELDALRAAGARKKKQSAYVARRSLLIERGQWRPYEDAAVVAEHVRAVMAETGMGCYQVAAAAGVNGKTVSRVLRGEQGRVLSAVAAKILAVTTGAPPLPAGQVSPVGSARRLQALTVAGWPPRVLAARLRAMGDDVSEDALRELRDGDRAMTGEDRARRVAALYDQLWNTPPPQGTRAEKIAAAKARGHAARCGWHGAGAWDAATVDDPQAVPAEGWERPLERKRREGALLVAEAHELFGFGLDRNQAAARLEVTREALDKALSRAARADASVTA